MSLFKVCTWWDAQCPDITESYDSLSLLCCRLGLDDAEKDYIVVGSHSGYLSIFKPNSESSINAEVAGSTFKPTDVVLEIKLANPIIGLSSGRFVGGLKNEGKPHLAVLHPMKIAMYSVGTTEGIAEHGDHSKLHLAFEHKLSKFAFSFSKGHFGGVKGREFICIVHMDGTLTFFEQDGISYEILLPGERNIPSPFIYSSRTDSFLTITSCWDLECYSYQSLSQSAESARKVDPMWSVCVGENAIDMTVLQMSNSESVVVILGEHNLMCLTDSGKVRFIKRLDYTPVCFHAFVIGWYWEPDTRLMIAVVSDNGTLLVYEEARMIWAAQLPEVPVAIQRSNLHGLPGGIVTLGAKGRVFAEFLGSEPHIFKVPPLNLQELNFDKVLHELLELEKEIEAGIDFTDISMINSAVERDLHINLTVSGKLERCTFATKSANPQEDSRMCLVSVSVKSKVDLEQIQIYFEVEPPLKCSKKVFVFRNVTADNAERLDTWIYGNEAVDAASAQVKLIATFINRHSIPRILEKTANLPLIMFFKPCQPQKEASTKVTFSVENGAVPSLVTLFTDFGPDGGAQAIGFQSCFTGSIVTIIAAKNSNRFRIQSDDLCAIAPILEALIERTKKINENSVNPVKKKQTSDSIVDIQIVMQPQLPIEKILEIFEAHFTANENLKRIRRELEEKSLQQRLFQRRFFVKLEDRSFGALGGVSMLLKSAQNEILAKIAQLKHARSAVNITQMKLTNAIAVVRIVINNLNLPRRVTDGICAVLVHPVRDFMDQNWEEILAPSLNMINHIGPLSKNKCDLLDEMPTFSVDTLEFNRFKKYFSSPLERACRYAASGQTDIDDKFEMTDEIYGRDDNDWTISEVPKGIVVDASKAFVNEEEEEMFV